MWACKSGSTVKRFYPFKSKSIGDWFFLSRATCLLNNFGTEASSRPSELTPSRREKN